MIQDILSETRSRMKSSLSVFGETLQGIRGNRASTALVDRLSVEYYGQETELRQLSNISTPEPMQILIRPYDKEAIRAIEKAIQLSDLGIHPNVEAEAIRLNMPPLTQERRQQLVKHLQRRTEEARVAIRNIRRSANDDLKEFQREKMISEDEQKLGQEEVQKLTNQFIEQMDALSRAKEADIMEL